MDLLEFRLFVLLADQNFDDGLVEDVLNVIDDLFEFIVWQNADGDKLKEGLDGHKNDKSIRSYQIERMITETKLALITKGAAIRFALFMV